MNKLILKNNGQMVWMFEFMWIDDISANHGFEDMPGEFLGTKQEFQDWCDQQEKDYGQSVWDIKKRHPNAEELMDYCSWFKEDKYI